MRVSTDGQTVENQQRELQDVAERHQWHVVGVFADPGVSGMREKRPAFDKLLQAVTRKQVDMVAAWSVDRLGRSQRHLLSFLDELKAKGIDLYLHQQGSTRRRRRARRCFRCSGCSPSSSGR